MMMIVMMIVMMEMICPLYVLFFCVCTCLTSLMSSQFGHSLLSALKVVGLIDSLCVVQGLESRKGKAYTDLKRLASRHVESFVSADAKVVEGTNPSMVIRHLSEFIPRKGAMRWRTIRSYMTIDTAHAHATDDAPATSASQLVVRGYLRGMPLNVNSLVHIPEIGAGRIVSISRANETANMMGSKGARKASASSSSSSAQVSDIVYADVSK